MKDLDIHKKITVLIDAGNLRKPLLERATRVICRRETVCLS
ncbi:hypothetical protein [Microbulbifer agarilyticus]|nr:hypothetical protein [Microbulbifer agarilyticus]